MFAAKTDRPVKELVPPWGVFVFESHHSEQFRMQLTRQPFLKVIYVLRGSGELRFEDGPRKVARGTVTVVPLGTLHQIRDTPGDPLALLVVCIGRPVLDGLPDEAATFIGRGPRVWNDALVTRETERLLRNLFFEQSLHKPASATLMKGLVTQLLAMLARASAAVGTEELALYARDRAPETRVRAYIDELQSRYHENEKIDNVIARLGISRRYFTRLFRKLTKTSWLQYVRDLRLQHAKTLLLRGERTVLSIAFEAGFDDVSTFYRAFKASERTTPQAWLAARQQTAVKGRAKKAE